MKRQIYFEDWIRDVLYNCDNFIYKSNLVLLEKYYNYIWDNLKSPELAKKFLQLFNKVEDVKTTIIEKYFYNIISEDYDLISMFSLDFISHLDKLQNVSGVYFIYNNLGNMIYIGKSKNLCNRLQQSFINKLPFNAVSVKYIADPNYDDIVYDLIEAIAIDFYKPMLNQQLESIPAYINYRKYSRFTTVIQNDLYNFNKIYVTSKKEDCDE